MPKEIISRSTRNEFREVLTGFTLREVNMVFESAGLTPRRDFISPFSGQRRSLVEQYYANVDFTSLSDIQKVVAAYEELMLQLHGNSSRWADDNHRKELIHRLLLRMERDGFRYENGRFLSELCASIELRLRH